jgi:hypothetical protein
MPLFTSNSDTPGAAQNGSGGPWLARLLTAAVLLLILLAGWEMAMRHLGLRAGDFDDGRDDWAVERRKVDSGPKDPIVIIGDSRILFDTDLATWQKITGHKPIQLALPAASPQPFLHELAADEHFAGLLVIGTAEFSYFRDGGEDSAPVLKYIKTQSPSQRISQKISQAAARHLAFLDANYTLFTLLEQNKWLLRKGVDGSYMDVWKISETVADRQTWLWDRVEYDPYIQEHTRLIWQTIYPGPEVPTATVNHVIAEAKADIAKIRARGGEVVWIRPPSAGPILEKELTRYPRPKVWDRLLRETKAFGIYYADYPAMQNLTVPDWSHLSRESALRFTDAYVRVLHEKLDWFKQHPAGKAGEPLAGL